MEKVILTIDCGTQSLRAMLFSPEGGLLEKARVEYEPCFRPKPGWAEQDPQIFWKSLCKACHLLKSKNPALFKMASGVGVTAQRNSMINIDEKGDPLRPAISWMDLRKARCAYRPKGFRNLMYKISGMDEAIMKTQADCKCNWIRQNQPEIWARTHKYLQISGFINFRLTGMFSDSTASQIGHVPFDYKKQKWAAKGHLNTLIFPVEEEKLTALVMPGDIIGSVTEKAAAESAIPGGIPVVACGSDKGCETIGMGVIDDKAVSLSFGTTATVQTTSKKYIEPVRFMPAYPAPIPGHYNPEVEIFRGYWMITWFKNEFGQSECVEADSTGIAAEELLNKLLLKVPPGSMGLVVQPYWAPGLKTPSAKGAIIGFGDVHGRAHVYRAVIEGLSYALFDGTQKIEKAGGRVIEKAAVSGGASRSDEICQISADIFDIPLFRGQTFEAAGLGAAIVTARGLGWYPSFEAAIKEMIKYERIFEPDKKHVRIYRNLYEKVYKKMFGALNPLHKQIREITGYPEISN